MKTQKGSEEDRESYGLSNSERNYWGFKDWKEIGEYNYESEIPQPSFYLSDHDFPKWLRDIMQRVWDQEHNPTTTSTTSTTTTTTTKKPKKKGYQFGDITKSAVKKVWKWFG